MRSRFSVLPAVAAAILLAFTVAGWCGAWHWLLDLASHFRGYWLMAAAVGVVLGARRPGSVAFVCCLLALVGNAWAMIPFWVRSPTALPAAVAADADAAAVIDLVTANLHCRTRDTSSAVAYLRDRQPDVAVLLEVTADWVAALSSLDEIYPHRIVEAREDTFGIAVLSRWPLTDRQVTTFGGTPHPIIVATVSGPGRDLRLFAIHPHPPLSAARDAALRAQLDAVAAAAATAPHPCVVAGDFNATPWSTPYRRFAARSGLRDTALGRGVQPTWNSRLPAPRIPIDHVFASPDIAVLHRGVGPDIGSDHFPVEATLVLPPAE